MRVRGIGWLGVAVQDVAQVRGFALETLGLALMHDDENFVVFEATDGTKFELFGPPQPPQFAANRVVAGFLVDDIDSARDELIDRGVELLGPLQRGEDGYAYQHFRAPDGLVFELTYDPRRS